FQIVKEQPIRPEDSDQEPGSTLARRPVPGSWLLIPVAGGANRDRTGDLLLAKQALSQLSYGPAWFLASVRRRGGRASLGWWVWMDSNHRPPPYQDGALTN